MQNNIAIKVENLTKVYHLYDKPQDRFKEALHPFRRSYHHDFFAVNDISFEIKKGETVGIIGKNGAGKSTLLKMITGVLTPTSGSIQVNGKIASLLELGTGFNPEMTGIENIYLNATLMGYTEKEVSDRVESIIRFADIGEFIEQPIKMYSSGMMARLGFAVAINVQPDVLIVDEALAVGDMNFQAKCMTAMDNIKEKGTTILFVSHDVSLVKSLCEKGIYIKEGKLNAIGNAANIGDIYERYMRESTNKEYKNTIVKIESELNIELKPEKYNDLTDVEFKISKEFDKKVEQFRHGTGRAKITYVELLDENDNLIIDADFNQSVILKIYLESYDDGEISVNFQLYDDKKISIVAGSFMLAGKEKIQVKSREKLMVKYTLKLPLQHNVYSIQTMIIDPVVNDIDILYIDVVPDSYVFKINKRPNSTLWSKVDLFPVLEIVRL